MLQSIFTLIKLHWACEEKSRSSFRKKTERNIRKAIKFELQLNWAEPEPNFFIFFHLFVWYQFSKLNMTVSFFLAPRKKMTRETKGILQNLRATVTETEVQPSLHKSFYFYKINDNTYVLHVRKTFCCLFVNFYWFSFYKPLKWYKICWTAREKIYVFFFNLVSFNKIDFRLKLSKY